MKSITIHGLTDQLDRLIRKRAQKHGLSLNKTIKKILENSLGVKKESYSDQREDFMDLFGSLTMDEKKELNSLIKDFDTIDEEDWR